MAKVSLESLSSIDGFYAAADPSQNNGQHVPLKIT